MTLNGCADVSGCAFLHCAGMQEVVIPEGLTLAGIAGRGGDSWDQVGSVDTAFNMARGVILGMQSCCEIVRC